MSRDLRVSHQNVDLFFDDLEQSSPKKFYIFELDCPKNQVHKFFGPKKCDFFLPGPCFIYCCFHYINFDKLLCFFLNIFL